MTFPEMIYKLALFFFSNMWTYIGLLLLIHTIKGDVGKVFKSIGGFVGSVRSKYKLLSNPLTPDKTKKGLS